MSAGAIVEELERLGVELRAVGDDLEYEGPEEVITPGLLERLKAHKGHLMRVCRKTNAVAEEGRNLAEAGCTRNTTEPEARKLSAAGWEPKERCGKSIWKRPDSDFYYSQEVALHLLSQQEQSEQERGKRKEVTQRGGDT